MPCFQIGDLVMDRNDSTRYGPVRVVLPLEGDVQYYKVLWPHPYGLRTVLEDDLLYFNPDKGVYEDFISSIFSGFEELLKNVTLIRLSRTQPIKNTLYAFNASRTRFYPYQFNPLIKFLDSEKYRLLVCDEVGLGKTIEAGLILTEFRARYSVSKVLIVCPSGLREKWKQEMKSRFDEEFTILKTDDFMEILDGYENSPERVKLNGIVSLETIRTGRVLTRLQEITPDFDMVIVDEAHHMRNPGKKQWQAGTVLSAGATAMVMLTATPVQLGIENLFHLLRILDSQEFPEIQNALRRFKINEGVVQAQNALSRIPPDISSARKYLQVAGQADIVQNNPYFIESMRALEQLADVMENQHSEAERNSAQIETQHALSSLNLIGHIYTRTRRRDVHENFTRRQAHPILVEFTEYEKAFYEAVTNYVRAVCSSRGQTSIIEKWILNTPQRRIASSIPAMVEHYRAKMQEEDEYFQESGEGLEDTELFVEEGKVNNSNGEEEFPNVAVARHRLKDLLKGWPENARDSKYEAFIRAIRSIRQREYKPKILVFAFFKGTLSYLQQRLQADNICAVLISGDVTGDDRTEKIKAFREDAKVEVLLSSKVGSEGLDFQFCHILFNYDLPWNPMEVEQRIGRLDRIGQESEFIAIYHFWVKNTIEERILKRLYERIGVFERSIGELELILGEVTRDLEFELFSQPMTHEEQKEALERRLFVIQSRESELAKIESEAARFIGTDVFFQEEVVRVQKNRLYITPEQLRGLVEYFLRNNAPLTRLEYDIEKQVGRLLPAEDLISILAMEHVLKDFNTAGRSQMGWREITFNGDVAFKNPKREFINLLHPLVRGIVSYLDRKGTVPSGCHYLCIETAELPEGCYFFFIYMVDVRAARPEHLLQTVILDGYLEEACEQGKAEFVFGEILEKGKSLMTPPPRFEEEDMRTAVEKAEKLMRTRIAKMREKLRLANDVFVDRRIQAIASFYDRILNQRKERLKNERAKQKPEERILKLLEGEIKNRCAEKNVEIEKLEARRVLNVEHGILCAGCFEVGKL